jgi:cobalt/nickel transport system ATP-binding protein
LEIEKGEFVVIKGDNGCGKSTLLNIINALSFAEIGEYKFNSNLINEKSMKNEKFSKSFHQQIGYVFQNTEAQLFCASVEEEIAFGPTQMGLPQSEIDKRVSDMINLLEIEHLKSRAPYHLSMGEKKKVAIGAVLAVNPSVLILDEPMNFLDKKSRVWIKDFLASLKGIKTIIIVSHTDDFDQIADRIINM